MQKQFIFFGIVALIVVALSQCHAAMTPEEMAKMAMPDLSNDTCAINKDCVSCLRVKGCNYCTKPSGTSFCTEIDNAEDALCVVPGCSSDTFIMTLSECSGGCAQATNCFDCSITPGCGWCQHKEDGFQGCDAALQGEKDYDQPSLRCRENASVWEMGSDKCYTICEKRNGRSECMKEDQACIWNGILETCATSPTGKAQEILPPVTEAPTKTPSDSKVDDKAETPFRSEPVEAKQGNSALIFVVVVGVVVGVLMYKKLH